MDDHDPTGDSDTHWTQVAQRHFDPDEGEELTTALVFAIAEAKGVAPHELRSPPLYDCVDAPALEATFFGPDVNGDTRQGTGAGTVEFRYVDYLVTVQSDGWIQVFESTDPHTEPR